MFDFEYDNEWDVDKTANSLNTSLFGKSKKQKAKAANSPKKSQNELHTSVIHDSDDEKYSRKGKKKLKERRRKKNKKSGNAKLEGNEENTSFKSLDADHTSPKVKGKNEKTKQKNKKQNIDATKSSKVDKIVTGKIESQFKKQKKKIKDRKSAGEEEINLAVKMKDRKRKRSITEDTEAEGGNSKSKRAKLDGNLNESAISENVDTVKKKRKRSRKKKNNSKKNKYKHLALNSSKTKESSDSHAKNNEDFPQVNDQNKQSQIELNGKEKKKTRKKAVVVTDSKQEKDKSQSLIGPPQKATKKRKKKDETYLASVSDPDGANNNNSLADPSVATPPAKKRKQKKKYDVPESTVENKSNDGLTNGHGESKPVGKKKKLTNDKPAISTLPFIQSMSISNLGHMNAQQSKLSKAAKLKQQKLARMLGQSDNSDLKAVQNTDSSPRKSKKKAKHKGNDPTASEAQTKEQLSPKLKSLKAEKSNTWNPQNSKSPFAKANDSPSFSSLWGKGAEMGLQAKEKLDSARFRYINEQLYSCQGSEAWQMFREDPDAFQVYHQGFENQVKKWSVNPLNVIIKQMKDKSPKLVVADFGCGDAKLAESIPQKVHSFDLVALNKRVTVCDISKTPLPSESVDIGVFCLSLMGTNISDYIHEANRVLKTGGLLKIAEVVSRFSGVSGFIAGVCKHGFQLLNKRDLSDMFYLMDFKKLKPVKKSASLGEIKLKPCIYKKR